MISKNAAYANLVSARKQCRACECLNPPTKGLTNPAVIGGSSLGAEHLGPWSAWQGNLDAQILIVGQDWGDVGYSEKYHGLDNTRNATNQKLVELLRLIGIGINCPPPFQGSQGHVFLTNAILCLKNGGMQAQVRREWFNNCGPRCLKPLIELIQPSVVISLGAWAYQSLCRLYSLPVVPLRTAVESTSGYQLPNGAMLFPMYHCGRRVLNTVRKPAQQVADWQRITKVTGYELLKPS